MLALSDGSSAIGVKSAAAKKIVRKAARTTEAKAVTIVNYTKCY